MRELAAIAALLLVTACGGGGAGAGGRGAAPETSPTATPAANPAIVAQPLTLPSAVGINYDGPATADGQWLGTRWLRASDAEGEGWRQARPRLQADLDFIASHHLGALVRVFIGIDQLMVWDRSTGFVRFDEAAMTNLGQALDMFDIHGLKVIAVLFDQEEVSSPGNFRFQALDGAHPAMRAGYLRALDQFLRRFGTRPTVVAWDLFNEAYNSLGREGGLHRPPGDDPVSPNYQDTVVHAWLVDLYRTAKTVAPNARFTVSDTTELYWKTPPDTARYDGAVDFYDIHVYDDHPRAVDWRSSLRLPYLLGEVGGDPDHGFRDAGVNASAVSFWLSRARDLGISAVLAHSADDSLYSLRTGRLTPAGRAVMAAG